MTAKQEYENLISVNDLMYYDGPILSQFKSLSGEHILIYWVDVNEDYNTWLLFKPSEETLMRYLKAEIDLRDCVLQSNYCELYDQSVADLYYNNRKVNIEDYPTYLPNPGVFNQP